MQANSGWSITGPIPKKNTRRAYAATLSKFLSDYGNRDTHDLTSDEVLSFLNKITEGNKPQSKKIRYAHLSSFFNFVRNNINQHFTNPCDNPMIKKLYRTSHANLSTTQLYLGKISDTEAIRWVENYYDYHGNITIEITRKSSGRIVMRDWRPGGWVLTFTLNPNPPTQQRLKRLTPAAIPHMNNGRKLQTGETRGDDFVG